MSVSPMVLKVYGDDNEVVKTITRTFVPFKILRKAVKLQEMLGEEAGKFSEEQIDALENFIIEFYGGQITKEELGNCDLFELITVLQGVMSVANGGAPKN